MPVNISEVRHFHNQVRQFFFVLSGTAKLEVNGEHIILNPQEGIELEPLTPHQMINDSNKDVEFLVISQPTSKGDRVLTED